MMHRVAGKTFFSRVLVITFYSIMVFFSFASAQRGYGDHRMVKNIIVLIPDGCDISVQTIARWYLGRDLMVDSMTSGSVKTWMSNSIIPGSAAAGTACATGYKTTEPFIGVGPRVSDAISTFSFPHPPEYLSYRPLASVLEAAKKVGKATGLVATSTISHATPASFSAHIDNRGKEQEIIEHQVYQNIDVVFGGGRRNLIQRSDGENLRDTLISRKYQYVETRDDMLALSGGRAWGMFADDAMQPDIDRSEFAPSEPSLSEMTQKAIDILSQDKDGFFLMVEGSQVDWAGHNNDPVYMITDFLAFDEAVRTAVAFARNDGATAVIAFPDHNTGGMTLGSYYSDKKVSYDRMPPELLVKPLKGMLLSSVGVAAKIADKKDPAQISEAVQKWWNIALNESDINEILTWPHSSSFNYRLASVVSKNYTTIGWTTHGHCGEDVPLWCYNASIGGKTIENTDIAKYLFRLLGVDSEHLNQYLFVDIDNTNFAQRWTLDTSNVKNPVLQICYANGFCARLPIGKNEAYITVKPEKIVKYQFDGLVIQAPQTSRIYLPKNTINLINTIARFFQYNKFSF
ncbi:MAG: alkaline phosphatase [Chitinivibrionales bacterium]|nr:alkaline phosphatase [Chitinivibrionales bacterium]